MDEDMQNSGSWPLYSQDELDAVTAVLRSGRVNYWGGEEVTSFERAFSGFVGIPHAIAACNGTVALELALRSLGIGPGDEVIVPSRTFIATASAVVMCGARPIVADIDMESQNITAETIQQALTPKARAVIVVHLAGWPCEMDEICELTKQHGLKLIEDCAQAHGAEYRGRLVGSFGDAAAFSFCQDKIISTGGEGGMLVTPHEDVWMRAWAFKDHGKDYVAAHEPHSDVGYRWLHTSFGTNWRMTEMQAAIGRIQLTKLPAWLATRRANAEQLAERLSKVPGLRIPMPSAHARSSFYRLYAFIEPDSLADGWSQDRIVEAINSEGIACFHGACSEIYRELAFARHGWSLPAPLPVARQAGITSLAFLVHPTLGQEDMADTATVVAKVMHEATR